MIKLEPGFPVFREAVSAIDWSALCWLEGDFTFFSTVCTDCLCHFSGTEVSRATKTLSFHCITLAAFDLQFTYFCQDYKYICMVTIGYCPILCYSGDDLASVILFMGKICTMNHPAGDKIPNIGKCISQAGVKSFHGTADYPALSHPPWFCNV